MKKILIYNYWLMIVAWCMFLNDYILLAILLGLIGCVLLLIINRKIDYWRMSFMSVISYVIISFILLNSSVSYFFPKLYMFLAIISLDSAFTFERLYLYKVKYLLPFLMVMVISATVLSIIALILPSSLYTIFTKTNLLLMINFIYSPFLIPLVGLVAYKKIRNHTMKGILQKKEASLY